jgi:hypothetical protein
MWLSIINTVLGVLGKVLPFLLAYKAGGDRVEEKSLTAAVKEGKVRNEIERNNDGLDRADIVKRLRELDGQTDN